jgi:hypothetical protein
MAGNSTYYQKMVRDMPGKFRGMMTRDVLAHCLVDLFLADVYETSSKTRTWAIPRGDNTDYFIIYVLV